MAILDLRLTNNYQPYCATERSKEKMSTVKAERLKPRVVHLTSGHIPGDVRIFRKECKSLAEHGYDVTLVARHARNEVLDGVRIVAIPQHRPNRTIRLTRTVWRVYRAARQQDADVYHFHDPELLLAGVLLKLHGKKVIYDVHEAFAEKLRSKPWIPRLLRPLAAWTFAFFEGMAARCFDHVIAADSVSARPFPAANVSVVANYPVLTAMQRQPLPPAVPHDRHILFYAGDMNKDRGLIVMIQLAELLRGHGVELELMGRISEPKLLQLAESAANVRFLGYHPLDVVYRHMMNADLGLVLLQPVSAYMYAGENTNKIFEYMSCGLPVVASDFPNLRRIVNDEECGVCVEPGDARKIANVVLDLLRQPDMRRRMGENGRRAVLAGYNWDAELANLLSAYDRVLNNERRRTNAGAGETAAEMHVTD